MTTLSQVNLNEISDQYVSFSSPIQRRIIVCAGTGCVANGSLEVFAQLSEQIETAGLPVVAELNRHDDEQLQPGTHHLSKSGCQGFCQMGPLVTIEPEGVLYVRVRPEDVADIVAMTLQEGQLVERLLYRNPSSETPCKGPAEIPFYARQKRSVLHDCGSIDPDDIHEYISKGGYSAAQKAYTTMSPEEVCQEILDAGLRGRGGGGFPTGRKLMLTLQQQATPKYVICNGDEGDPGAFMDRSVMEGNPHSVIEGMLIAARATGATEGYVYVRAEYPLAVKRVRHAVEEAYRLGLLGEDLFGSPLTFHCRVMEGAGAFVCGEETALISSIEGRRGMPNPKPPFPAQSGLWGCPTVINNVETLATVPIIIRQGAAAFRQDGTPNSPGTKTFALTGHVCNTGLIEVPFGSTLREIIFNIGGGVTGADGRPAPENFKAVQIGGPSGGCLTAEHLDLPMDFDSLREVGAMVGSGGLVVMNQQTCMVKVARFFMQFTQNESCGKCVLCREGTRQMLALLDTIIEGTADLQTLDLLEQLARAVQKGSLCGLGKTAPNPVLATLRYFRDEVEEHILHKRCPAGECEALMDYRISPDLCKGCGLCVRKCPVGAIRGARKEAHTIDPKLCIKCGACAEACKFDAITRS